MPDGSHLIQDKRGTTCESYNTNYYDYDYLPSLELTWSASWNSIYRPRFILDPGEGAESNFAKFSVRIVPFLATTTFEFENFSVLRNFCPMHQAFFEKIPCFVRIPTQHFSKIWRNLSGSGSILCPNKPGSSCKARPISPMGIQIILWRIKVLSSVGTPRSTSFQLSVFPVFRILITTNLTVSKHQIKKK